MPPKGGEGKRVLSAFSPHVQKGPFTALLSCLSQGQISCSLQCFYKSTSDDRVFQCDVTFRAVIGHCVCFVGHSVRTRTGTIFKRSLNNFAIFQWHFTLCRYICRLWNKCIPQTADSSECLERVCQAAILIALLQKLGLVFCDDIIPSAQYLSALKQVHLGEHHRNMSRTHFTPKERKEMTINKNKIIYTLDYTTV